MAAEVEDVDLIVGGHSHTFLFSGEQYLNLLQKFLKCNFLIRLKEVFSKIFWKPVCCPKFLCMNLGTSDLPHKPGFKQKFRSTIRTEHCTAVKLGTITHLNQVGHQVSRRFEK